MGTSSFTLEENSSPDGVIYKIVEDLPPQKPASEWKIEKKTQNIRNSQTFQWEPKVVDVKKYGAWDEKGKPILKSRINGAVRIAPVFTFFPTSRGSKPIGKGGTIIVEYCSLYRALKRVDLVEVCGKFAELGEFIRGMQP